MINLGLNPASLLGIILAVAGAGLYFLRTIRPELSRDHDIFFAAIGLLTGLILISQGWRLDPILQFGQFLLAGSAGFFAFESIRLRGVATEQAKRNTPIVDEDRPVSRNYEYQAYDYQTQRAELYDELNPAEDRPVRPRIRGSKDSRSSNYSDDYQSDSYSYGYGEAEGRERRRPSRSISGDREATDRDRYSERTAADRNASERTVERVGRGPASPSNSASERSSTTSASERSDRPKKRRPRILEDRISDYETEDTGADTSTKSSRSERRGYSEYGQDQEGGEASTRPRRSRSSQGGSRSRAGSDRASTTDYADYEPISYNDQDKDNSASFE